MEDHPIEVLEACAVTVQMACSTASTTSWVLIDVAVR
jgi:hypothetical protein